MRPLQTTALLVYGLLAAACSNNDAGLNPFGSDASQPADPDDRVDATPPADAAQPIDPAQPPDASASPDTPGPVPPGAAEPDAGGEITCAPPLTACPGGAVICADLATDEQSCGGCGHAC